MIDEADEAMPGQPSSGRKRLMSDSSAASPRPNKRKPGKLTFTVCKGQRVYNGLFHDP